MREREGGGREEKGARWRGGEEGVGEERGEGRGRAGE